MLNFLFPPVCPLCLCANNRGAVCWPCRFPEPASRVLARCSICDHQLADDTPCALCSGHPLPIRAYRSWGPYSGIAREWITQAKYRPNAELARILAATTASRVYSFFPSIDWELIVPTPCSPSGLLSRGFSLPGLMAEAIGKAVGIPPGYSVLMAAGNTKPQASVAEPLRISNALKNLPSVALHSAVHGKRILLVDDVLTTGSTAFAAVVALLEAGAAEIDLFTVAHSPQAHLLRPALHRGIASMVGQLRSQTKIT